MEFSVQQNAIISANDKRIVVNAGPGSGKTTVLIARINRLIEAGANPKGIVAITYTRSAAQVLQERVGHKLGFVGTLHSYLLNELNRTEADRGGDPLVVLPEEAADASLKKVLQRTRSKMSFAKAKALKADEGLDTAIPELKEYYFEMINAGRVDFDMILHKAMFMFRSGMWDQKKFCEHMFVDEFQDVSNLDMEIYENIFGGCESVFVVGDENQAIFGFRGGSNEHLSKLRYRAEWTSLRLTDNRRSAPDICDIANRIFEGSTQAMNDRKAIIAEVCMPTYEEELVEIAKYARRYYDNGSSVGIIARNNHICNGVSDKLRFMRVPVQRTIFDAPVDWAKAKAILALHNNPMDDALAEHFLQLFDVDPLDFSIQARKTGLVITEIMKQTGFPDFFSTPLHELFSKYGITKESQHYINAASPEDRRYGIIEEIEDQFITEQDGVVVATAHSAKGMEFDTVILAHMTNGVFPTLRMSSDVQEEERLFYVAVTRARHNLIAFWAKDYQPKWGPPVDCDRSDFLKVIDYEHETV